MTMSYTRKSWELFFDRSDRDTIIDFMSGQQDAIEGLTRNNRAFADAYLTFNELLKDQSPEDPTEEDQ